MKLPKDTAAVESARARAVSALAQVVAATHRSGLKFAGILERCASARTFVFTVWCAFAAAGLSPSDSAQISSAAPPASPITSLTGIADVLRPHTDQASIGLPLDSPLPILAPSRQAYEVVSGCWGGAQMHVEQAWRLAGTPRATLVAVLDTGIDVGNAGLTGRVAESLTLLKGTESSDSYGHGTHVAATIAAIAPNCTILSLKVADDRGFCTPQRVAEGIRLATMWGADVINLSLQVEPCPDLASALEDAWKAGAVLVAAAGTPEAAGLECYTAEEMPPTYPACYPCVIAVAGIGEDGEVAPLSNRASWIDVAAPGRHTLSYVPGSELGYLTGTSTAAAHVSGLAALLCGIAVDGNNNGRLNDEVRRAIESTAVPTDIEGIGRGTVDAAAAVQSLLA